MTSRIGIGIVAALIIFMGMKGCVVTVWTSGPSLNSYALYGDDGRAFGLEFLPKNETIIWYIDPAEDSLEATLVRMRGAVGTHYFWRFWKIDGPGVMFGYRMYPADVRPVYMEIEVLERYMRGNGNPTLPDKGDRTREVLLFGDDRVKFEGMWLRRSEPNREMAGALLRQLAGRQLDTST